MNMEKLPSDLTGQVFGQLTVLSRAGSKGTSATWHCRCTCGSTTEVRRNHLVTGHTTSCGCAKRAAAVSQTHRRTHGYFGTRVYKVWVNMKQRCLNPKNARFSDYGGRGISIDPRWECFETFLEDMGEPPSDNHTLERDDNDLGYSKQNCRWIPKGEQAVNKRTNVFVEYDGRRLTVAQWARELGIPTQTIHARIRRGLSPAEILTTRSSA